MNIPASSQILLGPRPESVSPPEFPINDDDSNSDNIMMMMTGWPYVLDRAGQPQRFMSHARNFSTCVTVHTTALRVMFIFTAEDV